MTVYCFLLVSSLFTLVFASAANLNDWNTPCFSGECYHHSNAGSMKVWGSSSAISDITAAGGWSILSCNASALTQDIRIVCHDSACRHLHDESSNMAMAIGKLVRLPEDCGASSFARVANIWVDRNQTIPSSVLSKIATLKRFSRPNVYAITLDTDFAAVDYSRTGPVSIAIQGSTVPSSNAQTAADFVAKRSLASFNDIDLNITKTLPTLSIDKSFPILDLSVSCPATSDAPAFSASLKADAEAKIDMTITLGLVATGTIIPPNLDDAGVFAGLDGDLAATLTLKADATGTATLPTATLFHTAIPGLDFPGILTLGPSFDILAKADATVDIGVDLQLDLKYTVAGAKLFFPPNNNNPTSGGSFENVGNPLTLSVTPSIASTGTLAAHIIPRLDLGLSALGGIAKASIFLNFDASADLSLSLDGSTVVKRDSVWSSREVSRRAGAVSGCIDLGADFAVNAGADASFFGLFDKSTSITLFEKEFDLFKQCFANGTASTKRSDIAPMMNKRVDLGCPTSSSIFSQLVPIASV
ncbi:hypothetical protein C8J56DRAFT_279200 [Mycena floridula]|nr:hypothetical protein C8J56DRAFT_279200 [Mycena floridula]